MGQSSSNLSDNDINNADIILPPERIRWFYRRKDGNWEKLIGRESLAIENGFRRHEELLRIRNPATGRPPLSGGAAIVREADNVDTTWANTAVAFGGLYGLDYDEGAASRFKYRLKYLYAKGDYISLRRGTWFLVVGGEWQPLEIISSDLVDKIEENHLILLNNQNGPSQSNTAQIDEVVDLEESISPGTGIRVRWRGINEVRLFNYGQASRMSRLFKRAPISQKLRRGYFEPALLNDGPKPVSDLVFVIHGIGQLLSPGKINDDVCTIRELADKLMSASYADTISRPFFVPIDWRSDLDLDDDTVKRITPRTCETIRNFVNGLAADVLFYANSRGFGNIIIDNLRSALIRAYGIFTNNDPTFGERSGRVSLAAHSLGSVLSFDLLSSQSDEGKLPFLVTNLFAIGSPLGLFVATMQKHNRITAPPDPGSGYRLYNVYNPLDIVASRVEPIFSPSYADVFPIRMEKFDSHDQRPYDAVPISMMKGATTASIPGEKMLPYRIDFALRQSRNIGSVSMSSLMSHVQYWDNADVTAFILRALYGVPKKTKNGSIRL